MIIGGGADVHFTPAIVFIFTPAPSRMNVGINPLILLLKPHLCKL